MLFHSCSPCSLIYHLEQLSISKLCCSHSFPGHLWKFWRTQISVWILLGDSSWPPCYKKWPVLLSFLVLINYLSMWDPCFWLYGCLFSLKAAAGGDLAECFWEVQVYLMNLISLVFLTCSGNFSRSVKLDFPLWSYVCFFPKCYICWYIMNWFLYSSFYLFALESHWAY